MVYVDSFGSAGVELGGGLAGWVCGGVVGGGDYVAAFVVGELISRDYGVFDGAYGVVGAGGVVFCEAAAAGGGALGGGVAGCGGVVLDVGGGADDVSAGGHAGAGVLGGVCVSPDGGERCGAEGECVADVRGAVCGVRGDLPCAGDGLGAGAGGWGGWRWGRWVFGAWPDGVGWGGGVAAGGDTFVSDVFVVWADECVSAVCGFDACDADLSG